MSYDILSAKPISGIMLKSDKLPNGMAIKRNIQRIVLQSFDNDDEKDLLVELDPKNNRIIELNDDFTEKCDIDIDDETKNDIFHFCNDQYSSAELFFTHHYDKLEKTFRKELNMLDEPSYIFLGFKKIETKLPADSNFMLVKFEVIFLYKGVMEERTVTVRLCDI